MLKKETDDKLNLEYSYIAAWITLTIHSSLEAPGLTAAFATALANENISCNVVAAYYHDHIFVAKKDAERAMLTLRKLAE
ncbi:ACT domain-containing protein [Mucilaginibacter sp. SG538B]|uniref:ACT domain-containing protein n=1 Tax=Mucilaginibacter sp. SG538B TaxID=2587021 RepID=UPI003977BF86